MFADVDLTFYPLEFISSMAVEVYGNSDQVFGDRATATAKPDVR
jgi:hypothetical protein